MWNLPFIVINIYFKNISHRAFQINKWILATKKKYIYIYISQKCINGPNTATQCSSFMSLKYDDSWSETNESALWRFHTGSWIRTRWIRSKELNILTLDLFIFLIKRVNILWNIKWYKLTYLQNRNRLTDINIYGYQSEKRVGERSIRSLG